jgi:hypothetical protein
LVEHFDTLDEQQATTRRGPSVTMVLRTSNATMIALGVAALLHVVRYALLLVNRSTLLNPWVAGAATWLGVAASVVAFFTVVASALVLTNWLIARRSAAYAHRGQQDPRPLWALRSGSLVPVVNLAWAPVFVLELAATEERLTRLRQPIVVWWVVWVFSTVVSIFSIATSFTTDPQGIANNTVTTTIAYLLALAALLLATQVFLGFERTPVERPARRWVIIGDQPPSAQPDAEPEPDRKAESTTAVESEGQNPAA